MMSRQECSSYRRSSSEGRSVVSGEWDHTIKSWQETSNELIWSGCERDRCTPEEYKHNLLLCAQVSEGRGGA